MSANAFGFRDSSFDRLIDANSVSDSEIVWFYKEALTNLVGVTACHEAITYVIRFCGPILAARGQSAKLCEERRYVLVVVLAPAIKLRASKYLRLPITEALQQSTHRIVEAEACVTEVGSDAGALRSERLVEVRETLLLGSRGVETSSNEVEPEETLYVSHVIDAESGAVRYGV